ncbi:hypothetical protein [Nocardiopsis halophila]|uniref:hypothetical protein n=1 Tax=Nocardiopsis halophila TaxID=141692 RepID=UPI000345C6DD|nr:hypothetical protein [Nocardiopsis halophila]
MPNSIIPSAGTRDPRLDADERDALVRAAAAPLGQLPADAWEMGEWLVHEGLLEAFDVHEGDGETTTVWWLTEKGARTATGDPEALARLRRARQLIEYVIASTQDKARSAGHERLCVDVHRAADAMRKDGKTLLAQLRCATMAKELSRRVSADPSYPAIESQGGDTHRFLAYLGALKCPEHDVAQAVAARLDRPEWMAERKDDEGEREQRMIHGLHLEEIGRYPAEGPSVLATVLITLRLAGLEARERDLHPGPGVEVQVPGGYAVVSGCGRHEGLDHPQGQHQGGLAVHRFTTDHQQVGLMEASTGALGGAIEQVLAELRAMKTSASA